MKYSLSNEVQLLLRKYSWTPERNIGIDKAEKTLKRYGIELFPAAIELISNLEGIENERLAKDREISEPYFSFEINESANILFCVEDDENENEEILVCMNNIINEPLCPFGNFGEAILLVSPSEKIILLNALWHGCSIYTDLGDALDRYILKTTKTNYKSMRFTEEQIPPWAR